MVLSEAFHDTHVLLQLGGIDDGCFLAWMLHRSGETCHDRVVGGLDPEK
jgi:hypothetical protein